MVAASGTFLFPPLLSIKIDLQLIHYSVPSICLYEEYSVFLFHSPAIFIQMLLQSALLFK